MSQTDFRAMFLDNILSFLWRQWSALGVLGEAKTEDLWAIDPEALLVFTLEMARYEPRLFDEVIDWLVVNGEWLDIQRLRGVLRKASERHCRLVGAVAEFLASRGEERKWGNLAKFCRKDIPDRPESLFLDKTGAPYPVLKTTGDEIFARFGFERSPLTVSKKSREVIPTTKSTIRFMLRALVGIGSRSECLLYLLTHDGGHPAEVAKAIGLGLRGTQDALIELAKSGMVLTRIKGKRKIEYWVSHKQWWEFLSKGSIGEIKRPVWLDWITLFAALGEVWETLNEVERTESAYLKSSKLREAMTKVGDEFAQTGLDIPPVPGRAVKPEEYEAAFRDFVISVFGAEGMIETGV